MIERALSLEPDNRIDAAIARVLEAERAAREDVAAARREALAIAEAARSAVRDLDARTERRIRSMRAAFAAATQRELDDLARATAHAAERCSLSPEDEARVDAAVASLAAALTGTTA